MSSQENQDSNRTTKLAHIPHIEIKPFLPSDGPSAAALHDLAFHTDPSYQALYPPRLRSSTNPNEETEWRAKIYTIGASIPISRSVKAVDMNAGGKIVGVAGCYIPGGMQWEGSGPESPSCADKEVDKRIAEMKREQREKILNGDTNVWELVQIMIDPAYQSQGIGTQLLQWSIDLAEADNLPIYVDASPTGKALYEKHGFTVEGEVVREDLVDEDGRMYVHYFMLRRPGRKG